jgi:hypothetical protein
MSKNPIINGLAASGYIVLLVLLMNYGSKMAAPNDSIITPMAMISVFTLSAAIMAYIFCVQPIQLYIDGKKKQAVKLFLQTVGVFGVMTLLFLGLVFFRVIK